MSHVRVWRAIIREGSLKTADDLIKFTRLSQEIFRSKNLSNAFIYLCTRKEATAKEIEQFFKMKEATIHRVLKKLREMDLIEASRITSPKRRGGPRPTVWRLKE